MDLADRKTVFVQKEPDKDWQKGYDYFYGATLQFFEKTPPKLVFVSRMTTSRELTHCMPLPLDIMLSQNHAFAKIWEGHYQQIGSIIATQLPQWLEEEPTNKATISMGGKAHEISFPPAKPLKTWLDVYIRKD